MLKDFIIGLPWMAGALGVMGLILALYMIHTIAGVRGIWLFAGGFTGFLFLSGIVGAVLRRLGVMT